MTAATQLFLDKGYELTSMEAVAKQAGVSKLTIYSHFADKEELFRAIVQTRCDKVCMPTTMLEYALLPVEEALNQIAHKALAKILLPDSIRLIRIILAEALHRPEIVRIYYEVGPRRVKTAFADLLREFTRLGKLVVQDFTCASEQFYGLLKGEMLQRILILHAPQPGAEEIEKHIQATISLFLAGYRPTSTTTPTKTEVL